MKYIQDVLDSGLLTSSDFDGGKYVQKLERQIRDFTGAQYAVAVNSGTSALYASLAVLDLTSNKVAYPAFTFKATLNAILAHNELKPVPVDVFKNNITIRTDNFPSVECAIPVHLYGHVAYMDELKETGTPFIIEDCCQALGSYLDNRHVGLFGDLGCFSFYPSKIINAGEGGAVITNNKTLADKLKQFRNHGTKCWGLNLRLSEIHACLAVEQFESINALLQVRKNNTKLWNERLSDVTKYYPRNGEIRNNQLFTITSPHRELIKLEHSASRVYYDYTLGDKTNAIEFAKTVLSFPTGGKQ